MRSFYFRYIVSTVSLLLLLPVARADVIGPYQVATVEVSETGIYFSTPPGVSAYPNPYSCQNPSWIAFDPSTPLASRALAAGLAAQAQGKTVSFNIVGCLNGHVKAVMIKIHP